MDEGVSTALPSAKKILADLFCFLVYRKDETGKKTARCNRGALCLLVTKYCDKIL
jgi:hypothetical protein